MVPQLQVPLNAHHVLQAHLLLQPAVKFAKAVQKDRRKKRLVLPVATPVHRVSMLVQAFNV
jgi:hypothetical protein